MSSILEDRKFDEKKAAELTGLSVRSLQRRRLEGRGPTYLKMGRRAVRYAESDLVAFLEEARQNGGGQGR